MTDIKNEIAKIQESAVTDPRFKKYDEDLPITDQALEGVNKLFNSILPHFPAWRQACPTDDDLSRLKLVWTKALMRNKQKTGKNLNLKAGVTACEESDTDWLPSVGKFIKMCEQSNDLTQFAERAYQLFIKREDQIETVGRMVTASHSFELRKLKAADCEKGFIELYLKYAADNAIETLDGFALENLTDDVVLERKRQEERDRRTPEENKALDDAAQAKFLAKFSGVIADKPEEKPKKQAKTGVTTGKIKTQYKSPAQLEKEKERQLALIKNMEK